MKTLSLVAGTLGAVLALSQVAYAESSSRVACLPMYGQADSAYWQTCSAELGSCACKDGFMAMDLMQIQDNSTKSGQKVTPVSASPG